MYSNGKQMNDYKQKNKNLNIAHMKTHYILRPTV